MPQHPLPTVIGVLQFKAIILPKKKFRSRFFDSAVDHGKNSVHILFRVPVKLAIGAIP
jgi:hypothetical protein